MAIIYDLDNEYGGVILSDSGTAAPALSLNSNAAGQPALAILSTASTNPVKITAINLGVDVDTISTAGGPGIDADSASATYPAGDFRSGATLGQALVVGKTVAAAATVAPLLVQHPSAASAPMIEFGHFASITSVILTSVANFDYAVRVKLGNQYRWIPLIADAGLVGTAAF